MISVAFYHFFLYILSVINHQAKFFVCETFGPVSESHSVMDNAKCMFIWELYMRRVI